MKLRTGVMLGLAAFLLALLFVLPAAWVGRVIPAGVQCSEWAGSIWRGRCTGLSVSDGTRVTMQVTALHWRLRPLALLRLNLAADLQGTWPQGEASGRVSMGTGQSLRLRGLRGNFRLDRSLVGALPAGWNGHVQLQDLQLDWRQGRLGRLGGQITVSDLTDAGGAALGGFRFDMPDSEQPPFTGQLRDTGGPLEVDARLQLEADRSWSLEGRMRTRDSADRRLAQRLEMLGSADATGWRPLSITGAFK